MSSIFNIINNEWFSIVVSIAVVAGYAVAVSKLFNKISERKQIEEKRFLKALSNGIKTGIVTEFSDIENIYKGVRGASGDEESNKARLAKWLRQYLLSLFENDGDNTETEIARKIKIEITKYIEQVEKTTPHAGLPDLERSIIRDIDTYLSIENKDAAKRKIDELVAAIQVREESLKKLESTNKWSVPLSVIGLILTVIFGFISLLK
jgi:hypothetical protein